MARMVSVAAPLSVAPLGAGAQAPATPPAAVESAAWSRPGPLVARQDVGALVASAAAAGTLLTVDERVARWSQRPALQRAARLRSAAAALRVAGHPVALALGGGLTYGVGLAARDRETADVGLHTAGAVVATSAVTVAIKWAAGRARPYATGDSNAHSFVFGRGLRRGDAYQAFPSGHASTAFAFATALSMEGRHRWARTNRVTEPLAYTVASMVALSRVYDDRHWASDVVMGAGLGIVTGRALVRHQHARPNNSADGRLLPPRTGRRRSSPVPATFAWSVAF